MDLHQGAKESVMDFYDKVKSNVHQWYSEDWENANTDADKAVKAKSLAMHVKLSFGAGLRPLVQKDTIIQDCNTVEELITVAMRVEASRKDNRNAHLMRFKPRQLKQKLPRMMMMILMKMTPMALWLPLMLEMVLGLNTPVILGLADKKDPGLLQQQEVATGNCNYCFRKYHKHASCFKRQNDECKGIFRENVNSTAKQAAPIEAEPEMSSIEMDNYLNMCSA